MLRLSCRNVVCSTFYQRWYKGDAGKGEDRVGDSSVLPSSLPWFVRLRYLIWKIDLVLARRVGGQK